MWSKQFKKEIDELEKLGVHTTMVKCGRFYSIPQIARFYKLVKPLIEKAKENETEKAEQKQKWKDNF